MHIYIDDSLDEDDRPTQEPFQGGNENKFNVLSVVRPNFIFVTLIEIESTEQHQPPTDNLISNT